MRTKVNRKIVLQALENVNKKRGYKLIFNRDEVKGNYFFFTIKSEKSNIAGSRISWSGRNLISASWHAHGYLFEEILKLYPKAIIISAHSKIDINGGNWQDIKIGSMMNPLYMSETSIL